MELRIRQNTRRLATLYGVYSAEKTKLALGYQQTDRINEQVIAPPRSNPNRSNSGAAYMITILEEIRDGEDRLVEH